MATLEFCLSDHFCLNPEVRGMWSPENWNHKKSSLSSMWIKSEGVLWLVWLSWLEHRPVNWKVAGLILGQGTCLGCRFGPQLGHVQEATDPFLSHIDVFLPLSFSLPSLLKSISMSSGEDFRKAKGSVKLCVGPKVVWSLWVRFQGGMQCWVPSRPQVPREWKHWSWWVPRHLSSAIFHAFYLYSFKNKCELFVLVHFLFGRKHVRSIWKICSIRFGLWKLWLI